VSQTDLLSSLAPPILWLGQSADTSSICSEYPELRCAPFLTSLGCTIRRPSLDVSHFHAGLKVKLGITGPLMVDSGGFVLSRTSAPHWTIDRVARFIERIDADIFVSLDHPPSANDTSNSRKRKIADSMRNFRKLARDLPHKIVMPVLHGRTFEELRLSIDLLSETCPHPGWVGLGGLVPLLQHRTSTRDVMAAGPEVFIARAIALIKRAFPLCRLHVFGAGGPRTFPALYAMGADSGDSIGWRQAAGFGSIFLPLVSQRVVKWRRGVPPPRKTLTTNDHDQLTLCRCPVCSTHGPLQLRLKSLRESFHNRSTHNAWVLLNQWSYWPTSRNAVAVQVSNGCLGSVWGRAVSIAGEAGGGFGFP
jgi:tRNA-guanine family transglycosylase